MSIWLCATSSISSQPLCHFQIGSVPFPLQPGSMPSLQFLSRPCELHIVSSSIRLHAIPKHLYEVIPKAKQMEAVMRNLAEQQETLKDDINQLKAQVGQIIEKLESMQNCDWRASEQPQVTPPTIPPQTWLNSKVKRSFHPMLIPTPQGKDFQSARMLQLLEERLDALEGAKQFDFDTADLCLVHNIVIPPKFELSTFDKYGGTTCPKSHLTMYCKKMAPYAHDDALLIQFF
ncbi:hypothetical protein CR513_29650, partial [Mucuna pruriens]